MTAREKFKVGDRVRFSVLAHQRNLVRKRASLTGTVCGFSRRPVMVRVRRDDLSNAEAFHMDFWERVGAKE